MRVMSAIRDRIGISSIGIQATMPTAGSFQFTKRKPQDNPDTNNTPDESSDASPSPHPPGTGKLVDKVV